MQASLENAEPARSTGGAVAYSTVLAREGVSAPSAQPASSVTTAEGAAE